MAHAVTLTDGVREVLIEEVQEERAETAAGVEFIPDITGALVAYERVSGVPELPISGRVKTKAEATCLESMVGRTLTVYERDGTASTGWKIKTDPALRVRRKDGESKDYLVDLRLWRLT